MSSGSVSTDRCFRYVVLFKKMVIPKVAVTILNDDGPHFRLRSSLLVDHVLNVFTSRGWLLDDFQNHE